MTSDLPGDLNRDGYGPVEPGLEQLLTTLTSGPAAGELAGEQGALAMFRANSRPPAPAPAVTRPVPVSAPARPRRSIRIPRLRIAVISAGALVAGFAAAAYAAILPAPVQHIAYDAFHVIGVPDAQHYKPTSGGSGSSPTATPGRHGGSPGSSPSHHPKSSPPGSSHHHSSGPTSKTSGSPHPSVSPSGSPSPGGTVVFAVQAASNLIAGGTSAVIDGQLTAGGNPDGGVQVSLMERVVGQGTWQLAGQATSTASGGVTFTTPVLTSNARFRLADAAGAQSSGVLIRVQPIVTATIKYGSHGVKDYVSVSTQYAQPGNDIVLQVLRGGSWVTLKERVLNSSGGYVFTISATAQDGNTLRVAVLATRLHAAAASAALTVGPPA
jgi:hypothetical protein